MWTLEYNTTVRAALGYDRKAPHITMLAGKPRSNVSFVLGNPSATTSVAGAGMIEANGLK